ncbi:MULTISPECIES: nuclear transport factor 2 family protein [unclassified Microbacterium]|uniref:nuclear transport factor 2 family protein n=1 Tax=unclassified Microbacterium TaxID=2609290 RepID=UPI00214C34DB|nr:MULTISPECIES: nuclear transport factor 2 family protein [unclassified Microbacterium]MCR2810630.1 nuclear transport factor 2 family protein [Microbacterium sp. zg.B185]WIM18167.1 nuclear transport factor 2 family protein [Microbacterium sp. zg-B185]
MSTQRETPALLGRDAPADASRNTDLLERMPSPVREFYGHFLAGRADALPELMHPQIAVRFPSYPILRGPTIALAYFRFQETIFGDLIFELVDVIEGDSAVAVLWRESGSTTDGRPWRCHGVDVFRHRDGLITALDVGGSARTLVEGLPRFDPAHLITGQPNQETLA